jgi:hypothetical protein
VPFLNIIRYVFEFIINRIHCCYQELAARTEVITNYEIAIKTIIDGHWAVIALGRLAFIINFRRQSTFTNDLDTAHS